jgi:hypothetical protein
VAIQQSDAEPGDLFRRNYGDAPIDFFMRQQLIDIFIRRLKFIFLAKALRPRESNVAGSRKLDFVRMIGLVPYERNGVSDFGVFSATY